MTESIFRLTPFLLIAALLVLVLVLKRLGFVFWIVLAPVFISIWALAFGVGNVLGSDIVAEIKVARSVSIENHFEISVINPPDAALIATSPNECILPGDKFFIDGSYIAWKSWAGFLSIKPRFTLGKIQNGYINDAPVGALIVECRVTQPPTSSIAATAVGFVPKFIRDWALDIKGLEAGVGVLADGAEYKVTLAIGGVSVHPQNAIARVASEEASKSYQSRP